MHGYTGKMAIIDLSGAGIEIVSSEEINKSHIGGRGVGSRILFDEVDPAADALGPENPLIFGTGPLTATAAPTSGRLSLVTKNVLSGGMAFSNAGGQLAPELKFAGFDHLLIKGKAPSPVYILIENVKIEIRDADHLWGKTVWETEQTLERELGEDIQVMSIGPAGEHLVKSACIMVNSGRAFGFGGCGAVMGSKSLKAVAIRGNQSVEVLDPDAFVAECDRVVRRMNLSVGGNSLRQGGTINKIGPTFPLPARNYQDGHWGTKGAKVTERQFRKAGELRRTACFNCPLYCGHFYSIESGKYAGHRSEGVQINAVRGFGSNLDIDNPAAIIACNGLCNELGLHIDEVCATLAWAFECYQRGIITVQDTDGLELSWGNEEAALTLIRKMAYREGFGEVLADGVENAVGQIGNDSARFAAVIKHTGVNEGNMRGKKGWALGICTSTRGGGHLSGSPNSEGFKNMTPEVCEARYGISTAGNPTTYERKGELVVWFERFKAVIDSIGVCYFITYWQNNLLGPGDFLGLLSAAAGISYTEEELLTVGERIINLEKAFNVLACGFGKEDDFPPRRMVEEAVQSGPFKGERLDRESWENLLEEYYASRGWDPQTGWPTEENLRKLGLVDVIDRLAGKEKLVR